MPKTNKNVASSAAAPASKGSERSTVVRRKVDLSALNLRRTRPEDDPDEVEEDTTPKSVSAGPIDKIVELTLNPTRDKIREVTIVSELQGRLFPLVDTMNCMFTECIEVATYRLSAKLYAKLYGRPVPKQSNVIDELLFRTAQWQKSVKGKGFERALDLALAETENRAESEYPEDSGRGYEDA